MLTVACVLRSGGIYDATWVARLETGVGRHLKQDHKFVCLSDVDVPCDRIPLERNWPGWWSKIELFRHDGPLLYLDLDTAIVGDLSDIAGHANDTDFTMLRDFYAPDHFGSGVMAWAGEVYEIYDKFAANPEAMMRKERKRMGDQAFIEEYARGMYSWQDYVGDQIVSYKVHCQNGIPANARVVCLHGTPKFKDMPATDPVRIEWER